MNERLQSIDFLRGVAALLVLLSHARGLSAFTETIGWAGVDLFFVLSGYLVSLLLFREYAKTSQVSLGLFFIRRGFKIYPQYYLFLLASGLYLYYFRHEFNWGGLITGLLFVSNFWWGLDQGTYLQANLSWSLSIEEHFYLIIALGIFYLIRIRRFDLLPRVLLLIIVLSPLLRAVVGYKAPHFAFASTFTRLDGLSLGVLIAYYSHFHTQATYAWAQRYRQALLGSGLAALAIAYYFAHLAGGNPEGRLIGTIGHSLLSLGCGAALISVVHNRALEPLTRWVGVGQLIHLISLAGFYSYALYLWHGLVKPVLTDHFMGPWQTDYTQPLGFTVYVGLSLLVAVATTRLVELPLLELRDRRFPRRA